MICPKGAVFDVFGPKLTFLAQFDEFGRFGEFLENLEFWPILEFLGIRRICPFSNFSRV
jgi:hypothetical protein